MIKNIKNFWITINRLKSKFFTSIKSVSKELAPYGLVLILCLLLFGCSRGKITDAENRIIISTELAKLDLAKTSLLSLRKNINLVVKNSKEPKVPVALDITDVKDFLSTTDCVKLIENGAEAELLKDCYILTAIKLINEAYRYDKLTDRNYSVEMSNYQYGVIMNKMLDILEVPDYKGSDNKK